MDVERKIEKLLEICSKIGLDVRAEPLGGSGGGLCRIRDKSVLFVDLDIAPEGRYMNLLTSLSTTGSIDEIYILPEIRSDLEGIKKNILKVKKIGYKGR